LNGFASFIHTIAAYWLVPLTGVHLGLHWAMFARRIGNSRIVIYSMRIFAFLFVAFGVWSSFDRDMFSKLFLGFSLDSWPEERPAGGRMSLDLLINSAGIGSSRHALPKVYSIDTLKAL
jgi:hypothetical protein